MRLPDLTIPLGQQVSNEIELPSLNQVVVYGPAALSGAVTLQTSPDKGETWFNTTTTVGAGARGFITSAYADKIRVSSSVPEVASRTFFVHGSGPRVI